MRPKRLACLCLFGAACQNPSQLATSSFGTSITTTPAASTPSSSSEGDTSSTGTSTGGTDDSAASSAGSTTLVLDVGAQHDVLGSQPAGCKGKIDFLFVISRFNFMNSIQAQLADAVPKFLDTIQTKFADFDYHIMVAEGDPVWGAPWCTKQCPAQPEGCTNYPCDLVDLVTECDETWGAGAVFNAGNNAPNQPCEIMDGRRYLTRDQPDLPATFACISQVGTNGYDLVGEALVHAVSPELNGPGGCNEGFLRDDALLVVTLATTSIDLDSEGTPKDWAQAVIDSKGGDPAAVVMFGIHPAKINGECWHEPDPNGYQYDRVCDLVEQFPYSHWIGAGEPDYGPGFDVATDLVAAACSAFIPQ